MPEEVLLRKAAQGPLAVAFLAGGSCLYTAPAPSRDLPLPQQEQHIWGPTAAMPAHTRCLHCTNLHMSHLCQ